MWEVKITGTALRLSIGLFTSRGKSKSPQLGPLLPLLFLLHPHPLPYNHIGFLIGPSEKEIKKGRGESKKKSGQIAL